MARGYGRTHGGRWADWCLLAVVVAATVFGAPAGAESEQRRVIDAIGTEFNVATGGDCGKEAGLSGSDNTAKIWNWLIGMGMSEYGAAGIMGNIQAETAGTWSPFIIEYGAPLPHTFDAMVSHNDYHNGFGLAQWDGSRRPQVSRGTTWELMTGAVDESWAANKFEEVFEGSIREDTNDSAQAVNARSIYQTLSGSASSGCQPVGSDIVTIAQQELALWTGGQMTAGTDFTKYSDGRQEDWCAHFAHWVLTQAGNPAAAAVTASVPGTVGNAKNGVGGAAWHPAGDGYTPKPGDLAVENWGCNSTYCHITVYIGDGQQIGGNQGGPTGGNYTTTSVTQRAVMNLSGYIEVPQSGS